MFSILLFQNDTNVFLTYNQLWRVQRSLVIEAAKDIQTTLQCPMYVQLTKETFMRILERYICRVQCRQLDTSHFPVMLTSVCHVTLCCDHIKIESCALVTLSGICAWMQQCL